MGSRLREKPDCLFEIFIELSKNGDVGPKLDQQFPVDYEDKSILAEIPKLAFPCETDGGQVEHFSFVVPDQTGMLRLGYCRLAAGHQSCLCVLSWLPWFEVFYQFLDFVSMVMATDQPSKVTDFLSEAYNLDIPAANMPVMIVADQGMFNFTAPNPSLLPSIPKSRNLTEYYNALDTSNMMLIFASMLHERRIYMTSKKLSRLTSCIFAAEALLYPMNWQHTFIPVLPSNVLECLGLMTPYVIGVHKSLIPRTADLGEDLEDTVFVDLDTNTVISPHDDLGHLPNSLVRALKNDLRIDTVKASVQKTGDAISMAFLKALIRLIGGYRNAFVKKPDLPVMFDEKAFVLSRSSKSYQNFLKGMLSLQIFNEFVQSKIDQLVSGSGNYDIFEEQAAVYAQRHQKKQRRTNLKIVKDKAAPMMTSAVYNIKAQSKKAFSTVMSGLTEADFKKIENRKSVAGNISKANKIRPMSAVESSTQKLAMPEIPPLTLDRSKSSSSISPDSKQDSVEEALGSKNLDLDLSLLGDTDIQAVLKQCPSAEVLQRRASVDSNSSSSSSSSDEKDISMSPGASLSKLDSKQENKRVSDKKLTRETAGDKLIQPDKLIQQEKLNQPDKLIQSDKLIQQEKVIQPDKLIRPLSRSRSAKTSFKQNSLSSLLFIRKKPHAPLRKVQSFDLSPSSSAAKLDVENGLDKKDENNKSSDTSTIVEESSDQDKKTTAALEAPLIVLDSLDSDSWDVVDNTTEGGGNINMKPKTEEVGEDFLLLSESDFFGSTGSEGNISNQGGSGEISDNLDDVFSQGNAFEESFKPLTSTASLGSSSFSLWGNRGGSNAAGNPWRVSSPAMHSFQSGQQFPIIPSSFTLQHQSSSVNNFPSRISPTPFSFPTTPSPFNDAFTPHAMSPTSRIIQPQRKTPIAPQSQLLFPTVRPSTDPASKGQAALRPLAEKTFSKVQANFGPVKTKNDGDKGAVSNALDDLLGSDFASIASGKPAYNQFK